MAGEDEDLLERERQAAEDRAFEQNPYGTGIDPDAPQEYDYEASPEATDVDYQPGDNGFSDEFTNHAGTDLYANQFGNHQDDDEAGEDADDTGASDMEAEDETETETEAEAETEENEWVEDWDGDEEADGKKGNLLDRRFNNAVAQRAQADPGKLRPQKQGKDKVNWKKGDLITIKRLREVWPLIKALTAKNHKINTLYVKARSTMRKDLEGIPGEGPNIIKVLRYYHWLKMARGASFNTFEVDCIDDILEITGSFGKTLGAIVGATAKAFVSQTWTEPVSVVGLKASFAGIIATGNSKKALDELFTVAVPVINGKAK